MVKYCRIAGLNVLIDSYGRVMKQAERYQCEPFDHADICITREAIDYIRRLKFNNSNFFTLSDDSIEYLATGAVFYRALLQFDGIRIHSSAVVVNNKAYLFSADSGTGKSTHTTLWLKQFGSRAYILNDDKPAVRIENGAWYAYGTPWSGKHDISVNERIPIAGVSILERSLDNMIYPVTSAEAVDFLITQISKSRYVEYMDKVFDLFDRFVSEVPVWKLQCNMDPEAAIVSYEAMSGEKFVPTTEM